MLRETRAKWLALGTALAVTAGAAAFAWLRNVPVPPPAPGMPSATAAAADVAHARAAFERLGCAMCHSLGGRGNPASPLDGVGARLDRPAIRDWTLGSGPAREYLPAGIAARKARAADDPDVDVLIDYLAGSR